MAKSSNNANLHSAQKAKQDEFYTQLVDIENELRHYKKYFKGKTVLCNCDDPRVSNFFHYFSYGFEHLGLKRLITTCYKSQEMDLFSQNNTERALWLEYTGDKNGNRVPDVEEIGINYFKGDGDFRSEECIELLKQADIVVTNPPFSLFREYVAQLIEYDKKFIIIGNMNASTYKEIFPLFRDNKIWYGPSISSGDREFGVPDYYPLKAAGYRVDEQGKKYIRVKGVRWFTNLEHSKRKEELPLFKHYTPEEYPKYDNYDAIEVSKTADIPCDYDGVMGVPITFLDKYNPEQFEIIDITKAGAGNPATKTKQYPKQIQINKDGTKSTVTKMNDGAVLVVNTPPSNATYYMIDNTMYIQTYPRILIRRKK
ncbi:MAG: adenine-specific methyltransferase EcoRI family protein [Thermoguttaceae bacterium]|nr:adenine-specific methyltransferase EcoRI family protein [Thermoguttaceae bacterium]